MSDYRGFHRGLLGLFEGGYLGVCGDYLGETIRALPGTIWEFPSQGMTAAAL